jgi:hypothetical protein
VEALLAFVDGVGHFIDRPAGEHGMQCASGWRRAAARLMSLIFAVSKSALMQGR